MGRVQTNTISESYAREATPGVLPGTPDWRQLEPNTIGNFGSDFKTLARTPITKSRQNRQGAVSDVDSAVEIDADLTMSSFFDFLESFAYAVAVGPDRYNPTASTATGFTVPALSAAQAGRLKYGVGAARSLLYARGFGLAANNGLKLLNAAAVATDTEIKVAGLTAETPPATNVVELAIAGVRGAPGDLKINAGGHLTSIVLDFTTLGLSVGQSIWVGGVDVANQFFNTANTGFARIVSIAANLITLEKRSQAFVLDDGTDTGAGGANISIDILFGQFIRNVDVDHADYREITNQFELVSPNLMTGGATGYEYSLGCYANEMSVAVPLTQKATVKFGFVALSSTNPSTVRASGAANAKVPAATQAFGTSSDIARLRVADVDESGLSTDFKSMTISIKNNVSGEKVLGTLGPKYVNAGNLDVSIDAELIFTNPLVINRVRNGTRIGFDCALNNGDGGFLFDIPSGMLSGGKRNYKTNESVTVQFKVEAFRDAALGTSFSASVFPVLPPV